MGGHCCHETMVIGVCHLSAEKYHLPLLFYSYIQIFNTILSFNLKPLHREHVKSVDFVQYFHMNMHLMLGTKGKNPTKILWLWFHNAQPFDTLSLLTELLVQENTYHHFRYKI